MYISVVQSLKIKLLSGSHTKSVIECGNDSISVAFDVLVPGFIVETIPRACNNYVIFVAREFVIA